MPEDDDALPTIPKRTLAELFAAGLEDGTAEYTLDETEKIRRGLRAVLGAEKQREGPEELFSIINLEILKAMLHGWDSRLLGGKLMIRVECLRGANGSWGMESITLTPAPMPRRASDGHDRRGVPVVREPF